MLIVGTYLVQPGVKVDRYNQELKSAVEFEWLGQVIYIFQGKESRVPPKTCSYSGNILYQERYHGTHRINIAFSRLQKCHQDHRAVAVFFGDTQTIVIWRHFDKQARVVWRSLWHLISAWVGDFSARCQFFLLNKSQMRDIADTGCSDLCGWKTDFEPILMLAWQFPVQRHVWPDGL